MISHHTFYVVCSIFAIAPIIYGDLVIGVCFAVLCVLSSFAIIVLGKRELVALLFVFCVMLL